MLLSLVSLQINNFFLKFHLQNEAYLEEGDFDIYQIKSLII